MRTATKAALAAALVASAGCSLSIDPESVKPPAASNPPSISLSSSSIAFTATEGGSNPLPQTVTVSNGGGGTLGTPAADVAYIGGTPGWLTANVAGAAAPYTITLVANVGALPSSTYAATVTVSAAGVSTVQSLVVTLTVASGTQPTMFISPAALGFTGVQGGTLPSQTVTVSNIGAGTLAPPTTSVTYASGSAWLTTVVTGAAAPYSIQVTAVPGALAPGSYAATVAVLSTGASNSGATFGVALTVTASTQPLIAVTPPSLSFSATRGDATLPVQQAVTIQNGGGGTLAQPTLQGAVYVPAGAEWLNGGLTGPPGGPYVLNLQPNTTNLPVGTYVATVMIASAGAANSPQGVPVTFQVTGTAPGLCIQTAGSKLCGGAVALGGAEKLENAGATLRVRKSAIEPGAAPLLQNVSTTRKIAQGTLSPGAATP